MDGWNCKHTGENTSSSPHSLARQTFNSGKYVKVKGELRNSKKKAIRHPITHLIWAGNLHMFKLSGALLLSWLVNRLGRVVRGLTKVAWKVSSKASPSDSHLTTYKHSSIRSPFHGQLKQCGATCAMNLQNLAWKKGRDTAGHNVSGSPFCCS